MNSSVSQLVPPNLLESVGEVLQLRLVVYRFSGRLTVSMSSTCTCRFGP